MILEERNVHIGEVKIGRDAVILQALLGSCVGIGLLWEERGVYGLAHCLLAKYPGENPPLGGRYVDQAVFSLLEMMEVDRGNYRKIKAIVAGGGNMTRPDVTDPKLLVGSCNSKAAFETLDSLRIGIIHEDIGGSNGRRISIDCHSGKFDVKKIPRPAAA